MIRPALIACFVLAASALSLSPSGSGEGEGVGISDQDGLFDEQGELRDTGGGLIEGEGVLRETEGDLIKVVSVEGDLIKADSHEGDKMDADSHTSSFDRFVDENYGDGGELADGVNLGDLLAEIEQYRPKERNSSSGTRERKPWESDSRTAALDVIIPFLQDDFKQKTSQLKTVLRKFKERQKELDSAKQEATLAMKELRKEAERRRQALLDKKKLKQKAIEERLNAKRLAKEAMIKKAQTMVVARGNSSDLGTLMSDFTLGLMMDVLMALPQAVDNPIFTKRVDKSKNDIAGTVQDFLNITRRKTAKFVMASTKASDVELSFLLTRYFHETSFRVRAMASDAQKVARDLNVVMPRELRTAFLPIIKQMRAKAIPLNMNASNLATADQASACAQVSGLMANITLYNARLASLHTTFHDVWQLAELMLPQMSRIYPISPKVIDLVKDFMSLATTQVAALQESSDDIVTQVGPVISERMQCTWDSAANRHLGLGLLAGLAALLAHVLA